MLDRTPFRVGRTARRDYTDLMVVVGPNARWTEVSTNDLRKVHPEVFLGYRVRLMTLDEANRGMMRGMRLSKVLVLEGERYTGVPDLSPLAAETWLNGATFEVWRVYRGESGVTATQLAIRLGE